MKQAFSKFWGNLGPARIPLLIVSVFLILAMAALSFLLLSKNHNPQTQLVASIVVPVEKEQAAENKPEESAAMTPGTPLAAAPDAALLEDNDIGPLPKMADDGSTPFQTYAKPFDAADQRPLVAIILTDVALSATAAEQIITSLPPELTLSFSPYAARLSNWVDKARNAGFEALLSLPMEPQSYPQDDPGPETLLTNLTAQENQQRLYWVLSRVSGPIGVLGNGNSKFSANEAMLRPVLANLGSRGLLFVDTTAGGAASAGPLIASELKMPFAEASLILDKENGQELGREAIAANLQKLVEQAKKAGTAVAVASPTPLLLTMLKEWNTHLVEQEVVLAPVSAVVNRLSATQNQPPAVPLSTPAAGTSAPASTNPAKINEETSSITPQATPSHSSITPAQNPSSAISSSPAAEDDVSSIAPRKTQPTPKSESKSAPQSEPTSIVPHHD